MPDKEDKKNGTFVPIESLPPFDILRGKILGVKRKIARDDIKNIFVLLLTLTLVVLLADLLHCIEITFERLILLGAIAAFALAPYANKLKILNIEFERKKLE